MGGIIIAGIIVLFLLGAGIAYLIMSFRIVNRDERAVRVFLGKPREKMLKPGHHFVWWIFERLVIFSAEPQRIDLGEVRAFSAKTETEDHESAELSAEASITFNYPSTDADLVALASLMRDPKNTQWILTQVGPGSIEIIKEVLSRHDWETAYTNRGQILDNTLDTELAKLGENHILKQLRLANLKFHIINVRVKPEELVYARARKEVATQEKERRRIEAETKKRERELEGEGDAALLAQQRKGMGITGEPTYAQLTKGPNGEEKLTFLGDPTKALGGLVGDVIKAFRKPPTRKGQPK